jgi:MFS family permease
MRAVYRAVMAIIACGLFGAAYGAIAGAAYGTLVAPLPPLAGTLVGLVCGTVYGFAAGIVGGSLGGPLGWSIGGLVGGTLILPLLFGWDRHAIDIHLLSFWIWTLFPGLIGALMGLAVGRDLQQESPGLPAVRWLRGTTSPSAISEWLWWRRGISDTPLIWPTMRMLWVLVLCLGGLLLATRSCHDQLRSDQGGWSGQR